MLYDMGTGGEALHNPQPEMTVTTFPSAYGYEVTRAVLACEPGTDKEGTVTQDVMIFETTNITETVSIVGKTLFLMPDGHTFQSSYEGQRRTLLKPDARKQYAKILREGYKPDVALIY
jgi:hypothetical protein